MTHGSDQAYRSLIEQFPLRPLRSDEDYGAAMAVVERLGAVASEPSQQDYLDVLCLLIEDYESRRWEIPDIHRLLPVADAVLEGALV